jgi:hypothetical protein
MPYKAPLAALMAGDEAIQHIRTIEKNIDDKPAIEQLRDAIVQGDVGAVLAEMKTPSFGSPPIALESDVVPPRKLWQAAKIGADGTVQFSEQDSPRPFKVIRENVLRIWPLRPGSNSAVENRCFEWLVEDLQNRGTAHASKRERLKYAKGKFCISMRTFERVWRRALEKLKINETATRPGRKRKIDAQN